MSWLGLVLGLGIGMALGFFGGGGTILAVPLFVYVFGLDPKEAIASAFLVVALSSLSAVVQHWRARRVDLRTGLFFGVPGMAGAHVGGRVSVHVDDTLLLLLFAATMLAAAWALWRGGAAAISRAALSPPRLIGQGLGIGLFTGMIGAGGGFVIVPALVLLAGLPPPTAIGTSLFILVLQSLAGFSGYVTHVRIDVALVSAVAASSIGGALLGAQATHLLEPGMLRRAFAALIATVATFIFVRESGVWVPVLHDALPASPPQLLLVVAILALGVAVGRASLRLPDQRLEAAEEDSHDRGSGI